MSEYYVYWRAQLTDAGAAAEGRFMRVVDELGAYPKIIDPIYDYEASWVGFGFSVDGFDSPAVVRDWAERALRLSLYHARVGAPDLPDGAVVDVRLCLDQHPTVRPIGEATRVEQAVNDAHRR